MSLTARLVAALLAIGLARPAIAAPPTPEAALRPIWPRPAGVVLAPHADRRWGRGAVEHIEGPGRIYEWYLVGRGVAAEALPAALRVVERPVTVLGDDGGRCAARVSGLRLVGSATPDAAQQAAYDALVGAGRDDSPAAHRWAATVWPKTRPMLVGTLDPPCDGRWAWLGDAAAVTHAPAAPLPPTDPLAARAIDAFRSLPAHAERQRTASSTPWDARTGPPPVWRYALPSGAWVAISVGDAPPDGPPVALSALWRVEPTGALTLRGGPWPVGRRPAAIAAVGDDVLLLGVSDGDDVVALRLGADGAAAVVRGARAPR